jgi:hypothetical protein
VRTRANALRAALVVGSNVIHARARKGGSLSIDGEWAEETVRTDPVQFDTSVAHPARVYDYWLGGKDNFAADREAAEQAIAANPNIVRDARANRAFLARAVSYLVRSCGIRQFLDLGTGIPTADNTHEVAQAVAPESRVVYVDNDPIVLLHARALLASDPAGATDYIDSDVRDTEKVLAAAARTLDFSEPIAVMLVLILHLIPDADDPHEIVARLMAAMPPGSYLTLTHPASDVGTVGREMARRLNERLGRTPGTLRDRNEVARFFTGLELAEPGIVQPQQWRPASPPAYAEVMLWSGVARKP